MDLKYYLKGIFFLSINMWNANNHKKILLAKWKSYNPKQEGQGHTNELSWNLIKVVTWISLWGKNLIHGVLDIMFWNENFEKVSSNWDQSVLFNKLIINAFLKSFLVNLHITKKTCKMQKIQWNVIFCALRKIPFYVHWANHFSLYLVQYI
jgi:hypothetical protein